MVLQTVNYLLGLNLSTTAAAAFVFLLNNVTAVLESLISKED